VFNNDPIGNGFRRKPVRKIPAALKARLARIQLFLCDVDGVLTDGSIFVGGRREFKRFNIRDGLGMVLWRRAVENRLGLGPRLRRHPAARPRVEN
jgi:hypothetical protein